MKYIIGNWKSNKTTSEVDAWFDAFKTSYHPHPDITVVICPPHPFLYQASEKISALSLTNVYLGAQDISPFPFGAYTGSVTAAMVSGIVKFALVGHSERREHFHESHQDVANKVTQLHLHNITPVVCIDEPYLQAQLAALAKEDTTDIIIAYEPLAAIGTGTPDDPNHVAAVVAHIAASQPSVAIIYGGSTKADNALTYLKLDLVSGLLPGSASLNPEGFAAMIDQAALSLT